MIAIWGALTLSAWFNAEATVGQVVLQGSVAKVEESGSGQPDPRRAHIVRKVLSADESGAQMKFEVSLKMRNFAELQQRVSRGEIIPFAEMKVKYYPTDADYQAVRQWVAQQGFTVTREDDNHLAIFVSGRVANVQEKLRTTFARVAFEGQEYTSAITAPSVPSEIAPALVGINGLQPHVHPRRHLIKKDSITGTNPPYLPSQVAQAYNASGLNAAGVTGTGQTIAIVIDTFPLTSDLTNFWQTYGVNQSLNNIQFIKVGSGTLPKRSGEETLDTEWSSSIAPGAQVRVYASASLASANLDEVYQQVYNDVISHPEYGIHQLSMSYGLAELYGTGTEILADSQFFANLASAGVTLFASSGDEGSTPDGSGNNRGQLQVENPADDPSVTGVGGTSLTLTGSGTVSTEIAWGAGGSGGNTWGGSGGGASVYFSKPAWQTGTGIPTGTTIGRLVPDVSMPADPLKGGVVYITGTLADGSVETGTTAFGGTSWSSPTWAGFCALINQARANAHLPPVGLLTPKIYPLLGTSSFRDITSGSNSAGSQSGGHYTAGVGYDEVTGIGVPNVGNLVNALIGVQTTPAAQTFAPGQNAAFMVAMSGTATGYQWQRMPMGSGSWSNLANGGTYSGATSGTLSVNGVAMSMSGDQFQCIVTTGTGNVTSAPPSVLVVDNLLTIATLAGKPLVIGSSDGVGGAAQFAYPSGLAVDSHGNIFVADYSNDTIREVTPAGVVSTPYGQAGVAGSANGVGTSGLLNLPNSVAIDGSDNIYVADSGNNAIRKITASGSVGTLAGQPGTSGSTNGIGSAALFNVPNAVCVDGSGNVYVADTGNNLIRKITPDGSVSTLAGVAGGVGYLDATGTNALFNAPSGIAVDSSGNVYVADLFNDVVRKITPAGVVTTPYGRNGTAGHIDGTGTNALFNAPIGIAVDGSNNIYVADSSVPETSGTTAITGNNTVRRINTAGVVSTIAGTPGITGTNDGTGAVAQFYSLQSLTIDRNSGLIYFVDTFNQTIRVGSVATAIATQPVGITVIEGRSGTFTVTASGVPAPVYQWRRMPAGSGTWSNMSNITGTYAGVATGTLAVSNAALAMSGDQFQCIASNGYTPSATSSAATLTVETGYTAWATTYFGSQASGSAAMPAAMPFGDSTPNVLKYLCDINPTIPMNATSYAALPVGGSVTISGTQYITLTFRENQNIPGLALTVQQSSDLQNWQSVLPASMQAIGTDPSTGDPIIQIEVQSNGGPKMFLRLQISTF